MSPKGESVDFEKLNKILTEKKKKRSLPVLVVRRYRYHINCTGSGTYLLFLYAGVTSQWIIVFLSISPSDPQVRWSWIVTLTPMTRVRCTSSPTPWRLPLRPLSRVPATRGWTTPGRTYPPSWPSCCRPSRPTGTKTRRTQSPTREEEERNELFFLGIFLYNDHKENRTLTLLSN